MPTIKTVGDWVRDAMRYIEDSLDAVTGEGELEEEADDLLHEGFALFGIDRTFVDATLDDLLGRDLALDSEPD